MNRNKLFQWSDLAECEKFALEENLPLPKIIRPRKFFENIQAMRALAHAPQGVVLGLGAGREVTSFWLTRWFKLVIMTDLYGNDVWDTAPNTMLTNPQPAFEMKYSKQRLLTSYMDMLDLRLPDDFVTGIYSCGSIEHVGGPNEIKQAAREMSRVTKSGGIITLSTEFAVLGSGGQLEPNLYAFTTDMLYDLIIEPSGCYLMDDLDLGDLTVEPTDEIFQLGRLVAAGPNMPKHRLIERHGTVFTSVSLALRKP